VIFTAFAAVVAPEARSENHVIPAMQAYSDVLACNRVTALALRITFHTWNFTFTFNSDWGSNESTDECRCKRKSKLKELTPA
jgi:hypothetical protein